MLARNQKATNTRTDDSQEAVLRLSDDIGKMADNIGDMADRIGDMSERILQTQEIQGKNLERLQTTLSEAIELMAAQMKITNRIVAALLDKGEKLDLDPLS